MNPLLFVFNPRRIHECVDSIGRLDVDQCWLTGMREWQLDDHINGVIGETDYTHYLCCSDDGVVPQFALNAVLDALDDGHPVATGYSNLDVADMRVNLTKSPFSVLGESVADDYDLYRLPEVLGYPDELVPTFFAGMALTGMTRDMWLDFPFVSAGSPSDWNLSRRLQDAEVPIVAAKAGFMWHVKELVNVPDQDPRKRLMIGAEYEAVTMRKRAAA